MKGSQVKEAAVELLRLYEAEFHGPFPYEDCRALLRKEKHQSEDLIPDLDTYFYNIASHCAGIEKVLMWPSTRLEASRDSLSRSFFEKHPQYLQLEKDITVLATPHLYARLRLCDRLRANLIHLISHLLNREPPSS